MDTEPLLVPAAPRPSEVRATAVRDSLQRAGVGPRVARAFASPLGVLITLPLLVVAVGIGILLVGRDATRSASESMARHQLQDQARQVDAEVALALDQAGPMLERLRVLADRTRAIEDVLPRMHDLVIGRPGVAYVSVSFPDGTFRGAYVAKTQSIEVTQSWVTPTGTEVDRYTVNGGALVPVKHETSNYDPRKRAFWELAVRTRGRAWTQPYTFFLSHETGITCTEPVFDGDELRAVLTVDFDVDVLSTYLARPGVDQARSLMYTRDGIILAYPAGGKLSQVEGLLRFSDLHDPAIDALFAQSDGEPAPAGAPGVFELDTADGAYLTSVAAVGGRRAGVDLPLDWFVATIVPARTLLGPTHALERSSVIASGGALAIAVALALVLAWNLVRMRRQVAASRAEARFAEARAKELGSYRLVAKLGAGGMGEVWRAEHRLLARSAAIKLIRPDALKDPGSVDEIRERFRREAQTLASMRSRHTIEIFDYGMTDDGIFYYVMELLDGLDLESLVLRYGAQPPARVIQIMRQACASLAEAHDAGLLHRDIKPPNLFVSRAADELDIVKLLDFGIVQTLRGEPSPASSLAVATISLDSNPTAKLTRAGAMLGTPGFMAPEQILGMALDGRADLYALGCVAWWLLVGREVFKRDGTDAALMRKHVYEPIPSLCSLVKNCPPELERVIASCLAKEAGERPATARALATRLGNIPIPDGDDWDAARAAVWWGEYQPPVPAVTVSPSEVQVIMPEREGPQDRATIRER